MKKRTVLLGLSLCYTALTPLYSRIPKLTLVLVVDQLSQEILEKLRPHFSGGLARLLDGGVRFNHAYQPQATPATATGHTGLSTGTTANYHGIVNNFWFDQTGTRRILANEDSRPEAAVLDPLNLGKTFDYGRSADNIQVDGLSDQFILGENKRRNKAIAISLKSRAATAMAGKLGKAVWYDPKTRRFTSSKAYYGTLPRWLNSFNHSYMSQLPEQYAWRLRFDDENDEAYQFDNILEDAGAHYAVSVSNSKLTFTDKLLGKQPYRFFEKSYHANKVLLDLANAVITHELKHSQCDNLLLWVSFSSFDLLAHVLGPEHLASLDLLYHLDRQLDSFVSHLERRLGFEALVVLTSDHGHMPIVEHKKIRTLGGRRINAAEIVLKLNNVVKKEFDVDNVVKSFKAPCFYLDEEVLSQTPKQRGAILKTLQKVLRSIPGIRDAATDIGLASRSSYPDPFTKNFYNQYYPNRSGQLTVQVEPYTLLTQHPYGTSHQSPYHYDTHVPLVFFSPRLEPKTISGTVWATQLAPTLADILEVPRPSASTYQPLSEIGMDAFKASKQSKPAIPPPNQPQIKGPKATTSLACHADI